MDIVKFQIVLEYLSDFGLGKVSKPLLLPYSLFEALEWNTFKLGQAYYVQVLKLYYEDVHNILEVVHFISRFNNL